MPSRRSLNTRAAELEGGTSGAAGGGDSMLMEVVEEYGRCGASSGCTGLRWNASMPRRGAGRPSCRTSRKR